MYQTSLFYTLIAWPETAINASSRSTPTTGELHTAMTTCSLLELASCSLCGSQSGDVTKRHRSPPVRDHLRRPDVSEAAYRATTRHSLRQPKATATTMSPADGWEHLFRVNRNLPLRRQSSRMIASLREFHVAVAAGQTWALGNGAGCSNGSFPMQRVEMPFPEMARTVYESCLRPAIAAVTRKRTTGWPAWSARILHSIL